MGLVLENRPTGKGAAVPANVSTERLSEIVGEVMDLIEAPDIFGFLDGNTGNMQALEARLQEVMMGRQRYECLELAMYLRTTFNRKANLPTWQPLCNATVEMCQMRGENLEMLYGLIPKDQIYPRNTDGMSGPRHPQMR